MVTEPEQLHATQQKYEIIIDGLTRQSIVDAMRAGITAACGDGIAAISAGNYNGKLGDIRFQLHDVMAEVR